MSDFDVILEALDRIGCITSVNKGNKNIDTYAVFMLSLHLTKMENLLIQKLIQTINLLIGIS